MNRPDWLTIKVPDQDTLDRMQKLLAAGHLHTVCEGADCPNIGECFAAKTCTFMILGDICTRNCRFCAVTHGQPGLVDAGEPIALALTAQQLGLKHVVVTSVTRDDLADGGASQFAAVIRTLRAVLPRATVEVLVPDFQGKAASLAQVLDADPDVINHNIETVPRLYPSVRPQAVYARSLELLRKVRQAGIMAKSGMMLGLGETPTEIIEVLEDLRSTGCEILTLGQYLSPSPSHYPVQEYIQPEIFGMLRRQALDMGFKEVSSGPLVRSSYHAARSLRRVQKITERKERAIDGQGR